MITWALILIEYIENEFYDNSRKNHELSVEFDVFELK
jgi:hypothetical protein